MKNLTEYILENSNTNWKVEIVRDLVWVACNDILDDDIIQKYLNEDELNDEDLKTLFDELSKMLDEGLTPGSKNFIMKECKYTQSQIDYAQKLFKELASEKSYKKLSKDIKYEISKGCNDYWDTSW